MQRILIQELQDGRSWAESLVSALILFLWTKRRTGRIFDGDATEADMYSSAIECIMGYTDSRRIANAKVSRIPFNSRNKYQASVHLDEEGKHVLVMIKQLQICSRGVSACRYGDDSGICFTSNYNFHKTCFDVICFRHTHLEEEGFG